MKSQDETFNRKLSRDTFKANLIHNAICVRLVTFPKFIQTKQDAKLLSLLLTTARKHKEFWQKEPA